MSRIKRKRLLATLKPLAPLDSQQAKQYFLQRSPQASGKPGPCCQSVFVEKPCGDRPLLLNCGYPHHSASSIAGFFFARSQSQHLSDLQLQMVAPWTMNEKKGQRMKHELTICLKNPCDLQLDGHAIVDAKQQS